MLANLIELTEVPVFQHPWARTCDVNGELKLMSKVIQNPGTLFSSPGHYDIECNMWPTVIHYFTKNNVLNSNVLPFYWSFTTTYLCALRSTQYSVWVYQTVKIPCILLEEAYAKHNILTPLCTCTPLQFFEPNVHTQKKNSTMYRKWCSKFVESIPRPQQPSSFSSARCMSEWWPHAWKQLPRTHLFTYTPYRQSVPVKSACSKPQKSKRKSSIGNVCDGLHSLDLTVSSSVLASYIPPLI